VETCPICRSELAPEWKFCVHCGTPIVHPDEPAASAEPIPPAIRPDPVVVAPSRRGLNGRVVFGIAMGSLGLAVVIYALVSILGSRG
jgi:hypothetical protein